MAKAKRGMKRAIRRTDGTVFFRIGESKLERHRLKKLGGNTGAASGVRRIDPQTGEVIEVISRSAIEKMEPPKFRRDRTRSTVNLDAKATAILRKNPEKKKAEEPPKERNKNEIRKELSRLRKARKQ